MTTDEIGTGLAALCKTGKFDDAIAAYYSNDIVSIEAMPGEMHEMSGIEAVKGKSAWWAANYEVHSIEVTGPYLNGDQFVVGFKMDVTQKGGQRHIMDEVGLYTVSGGKIVREVFYYDTK